MTDLATYLREVEALVERARGVIGQARPMDVPDEFDLIAGQAICQLAEIDQEHASRLAEMRFVARMQERLAYVPTLVQLVRELSGALVNLLISVDRHDADAPHEWLDHACGECVGYDADRGRKPQLCARHAAHDTLTRAERVVKERG